MKTVIFGSRTITNYSLIEKAISEANFIITELVSGHAPGVDTLAERWARLNGIPITPFPAQWNKYGKKAGPLRNADMANYAEQAIGIWDGKSPGTKDMINKVKAKSIPVYIMKVDGVSSIS